MHEASVEENRREETPNLCLTLHLVGFFHSEFIQHMSYIGTQKGSAIEWIAIDASDNKRRNVHENINHSDEENEGNYRKSRAESKLQHVEERLLSWIHKLLV